MKVEAYPRKKSLVITFSDGEVIDFTIDSHGGVSFLNKIQFYEKDIHFLSSQYDSFEEEYKYLLKNILIMSPDEVHKRLQRFVRVLIEAKKFDVSKYCDESKATKASIYFDPQDMEQILEMILILKLLAPVTHDSRYLDALRPVLKYIAKRYDDVNKRLFQLVKYRLKFDMTNVNSLQFLKYALSDDYLVFFNYDFVLLTTVAFYDTDADMNPVSYIVSVAADNSIYAVMSFSTQPYDYFDPDEAQVKSNDILYDISDQLLIMRMIDIAKYNLRELKVQIRSDLYPTSLYDHLVVPVLVLVTGISPTVLYELDDYSKLHIQWLTLQILMKIENSRKLLGDSSVLFLFASDKKNLTTTTTQPTILKLLYRNFVYKGLDIRKFMINNFNDLSVLSGKSVYHMINGKRPENINTRKRLERVLDFLLYLLSDKTRTAFITEARQVIHEVLAHDKITLKDFKKSIRSVSNL